MSQESEGDVIEFPDPLDFVFPEEVVMPDGTIIRGRTVEESGIFTNIDTWKLFPLYQVETYDPDSLTLVITRDDGTKFKMPSNDVVVSTVIFLLDNPGATPNDIVSSIIDWKSEERHEVLEDEKLMASLVFFVINILVMLYMFDLIRIEK